MNPDLLVQQQEFVNNIFVTCRPNLVLNTRLHFKVIQLITFVLGK